MFAKSVLLSRGAHHHPLLFFFPTTVHRVLSGKSRTSQQKSSTLFRLTTFWTTHLKRNALLLYPATASLLDLFIFLKIWNSDRSQYSSEMPPRVADKCLSFLPGKTFMYVQIFPRRLNGGKCVLIQQSLAAFETLMKCGYLSGKLRGVPVNTHRCFSPLIDLVDVNLSCPFKAPM